MAVPDYQAIMLPLLNLAGDGKEHTLRSAIEALGDHFGLSEDERKELLPSGRQATFDNRVGWARTYLKKAGLIESPKRGVLRITKRGKQVLSKHPSSLNVSFLEQFEGFQEFRALRHDDSNGEVQKAAVAEEATPEESLESAHQKLKSDLAIELLQTMKELSPSFFEKLVVDVLVKMGYGGTRQDAGRAVGKSGDDGIDGIIKEDRLGLDTIYVQAKRWTDSAIGRPEVQKFAGALQGHRARKGIFITTSSFTKEAHEYVSRIDSKIVLIDGAGLAKLMIDHNVGVATIATYEVKRIDSDYFQEA